ncbi:MAG: CYTH domain-containing protein, partial [Trueperaceae bacterium]|nr:CYTH domain-containing protein [Trueperaceae bacterium]
MPPHEPTERELKYSLVDPPPREADLLAAAGAGPYAFVPFGTAVHVDRYFDDDDASLAAAGVALRRREADGATIATLKTLGTVAGARHEREELEAPMHGDDWPVPVARRLAEHVALWQLRPRVELTTERTSYRVVHEGRPVAVLAFDEVRARLPEGAREALFAEAEVEA